MEPSQDDDIIRTEDNKRPLTPESADEIFDSGDDMPAAGKKQRLNEQDADPRNDLKYRIWEQITRGGGEASVETMCSDVEDRDEVLAAASEMEEEGRVMISDGKVYQID